jgi:hypothetical protein
MSRTPPEIQPSRPLLRKLRSLDVEAEYGIPQQTQANWRCAGKGPPFERVSSRMVVYDRADLEAYFAARKVTPGRVG